jgi:hypothetical protein
MGLPVADKIMVASFHATSDGTPDTGAKLLGGGAGLIERRSKGSPSSSEKITTAMQSSTTPRIPIVVLGLSTRGSASGILRLELVFRNCHDAAHHRVVAGSAEFITVEFVLVRGGEPKMNLGDGSGNRFHFGAGDLESVRRIRAGDSQPDRDSGRHGYAGRHKDIFLRDHMDGHRAIRCTSRSQIALDEFAVQMQSCEIYAVAPIKNMRSLQSAGKPQGSIHKRKDYDDKSSAKVFCVHTGKSERPLSRRH